MALNLSLGFDSHILQKKLSIFTFLFLPIVIESQSFSTLFMSPAVQAKIIRFLTIPVFKVAYTEDYIIDT
jgi:hypothetical protein